ncbi:MAG: xseB [Chlamydiales bacterium]|jgi:exodeoxyribonuclease VII small subunit|nr:xseB [Chlamydiales bacterium]
MTDKNPELSFESAFDRLESILESLNSETVSLDDSIKLYEEADHLIRLCNKRLSDAQQKVEVLIKNRNQELSLDSDGLPLTQDFAP